MASTKISQKYRLPGITQDRHRTFIYEYCVDYDGSRAARVAGYKGTPSQLSVRANKLLKQPKIRNAIKYIQEANLERCNVTREALIEELSACF